MPGSHNIWSPSKLERNIKCPGSVNLYKIEGQTEEIESGDVEAVRPWLAEGTLAHEVCEALIKGEPVPDNATEEMINLGQDFADFVSEFAGKEVIVEEKLVHPDHPDFGGTPDVLLIREVDGKRELHIIDYKFGKGLRVDAKDNYQLRGYLTLGMRTHGDFDVYFGHIFQPRLGGISFDEWTHDEIKGFESTLTDAMTSVELRAGEHCRWCPHLSNCSAVRSAALKAASQAFGTVPDDPEEWRFLLDHKEAIKSLLEEAPRKILEYMKQGLEFEGYKVVLSTGRTTWNDEEEARVVLSEILPKAELYNVKIKTPSQIKKLGDVDEDILRRLSGYEVKGMTVVREKDKRKAIDPTNFEEI